MGYAMICELLSEASSVYTGADAVKDWFELQLETWITTTAARQHQHSPMLVLANSLIHDTYAVINWEHVARAFHDDYQGAK